jgi:hypothetical protein
MSELKVKKYKRGKLTVWATCSENADIIAQHANNRNKTMEEKNNEL